MKPYKTILGESEIEISIQKSKFIGYAMPIESEEEAVLFIERIKKKHYTATHNVPVYLLGDDMSTQRYSDDGEPSGTAGVPVLEMLKREGITNLCIVITRYFGGIKLGTGGLVRAYTEAAQKAIEQAKIVNKAVYRKVELTLAYPMHGKIQNALMLMDNVVLEDTQFSDHVVILLYVIEGEQEQLSERLIDLTSSNVEIKILEPCYLTLYNGEIV
ncbi:YigZ family protein [Fusibacter ferrireducens]|uniref:YigZ family protein n=1 Tax=Fusibacter ferrireducens TaxID=2785058 RepID=A0ABR9ZV25_9FIRM|nr:YigZ family protein [Fusibacter ferrireducens]MBF4693826.1 YigZ family protein [Fusibacter ferrireducens]